MAVIGIHSPKPMMHIAYAPNSKKLKNFPDFPKILLFLFNLRFLLNARCLLSPYFDHDSFTHHALHSQDAPGGSGLNHSCSIGTWHLIIVLFGVGWCSGWRCD